ncbi:hypothetical protein PHISCL_00846 [Aspergillus sclerotialis]|uniref:Uncharacterized protein n=1 Tax=Aspergillus sclerotialis TaxID=2070753 RepID=A0A3A3ABX6_9EURO|nr:hypothetical protein PHISCL_00846 [Aspergillus sclerotialis]
MTDYEHGILTERRRRRKELSEILREHPLISNVDLKRYRILHECISLEDEPKPQYFGTNLQPRKSNSTTFTTATLRSSLIIHPSREQAQLHDI